MLDAPQSLPGGERDDLGGLILFDLKWMAHGFFSLVAKKCDPEILRHSQKDFAFGVKNE